MIELGSLWEEEATSESSLSVSAWAQWKAMGGHSEKAAVYKQRREASAEPNPNGTLSLDF